MSNTINRFLGTTSSDAFLDYYNQQKFCDITLGIKGDKIANLDMREQFFDESPQTFQRSTNNTIDQNLNVPYLGASTESLSTLGDSTECDCQRLQLRLQVILAKTSTLLKYFLETATNLLEKINPIDQSFETTLCIAAMTQEGGRKIMQVEVKDVSESSMESILTCIHTTEPSFKLDNFAKLLHDADKLQFSGVRKPCQDFLINEPLDASNCIPILSMNFYSGNEEAINVNIDFLIRNISDVLKEQKEEDIRRLPLDIMERVMSSQEIVDSNAEDAFKMLIIWADGGQGSKTANLHALMKPKIGLLSFDFLLANLVDPEVIQLDHASSILVHSTMMAKKPVSTFFPSETSIEAQSSQDGQSSPLTTSEEANESNEKTLLVIVDVWGSRNRGTGIFEKFDTGSNEWIKGTSKYLGKAFEAVIVGEFLAIIGQIKDGQFQRDVKLYNIRTRKWISGPNMINRRILFGCCVVNNDTVIVCGGLTTKNEHFGECELLKLNSDGTGQWESLPSMVTARFCGSAVSIGNRVLNIGGQIGKGEAATVYSTVEEFDVTSRKWTTRSSMNEARSNFAIATHQKMIYVFGGWRGMRNLNSCERYNPLVKKWQYICCLPSPRQGCAAGLLKNRIFVLGGIDSDLQSLKATEVYDPREDKFQRGPDLNNQAYHPSCLTVKKRLVFN